MSESFSGEQKKYAPNVNVAPYRIDLDKQVSLQELQNQVQNLIGLLGEDKAPKFNPNRAGALINYQNSVDLYYLRGRVLRMLTEEYLNRIQPHRSQDSIGLPHSQAVLSRDKFPSLFQPGGKIDTREAAQVVPLLLTEVDKYLTYKAEHNQGEYRPKWDPKIHNPQKPGTPMPLVDLSLRQLDVANGNY